MTFDLSPDDTKRWRVPSAKAYVTRAEDVDVITERCRSAAIRFVVVRCPAEATDVAQSLERAGMLLMDTLVYFSRSLKDWTAPASPEGIAIRPLLAKDLPIVTRIAEEAFRGYEGHYHADHRLDRAECDAVYVDWSMRLCHPTEYPSIVRIAFADGEPVGYMAFRVLPGEPGEAVLGGVANSGRRRGVYRALLADGVSWIRDAGGAESAMLSTQIGNASVQKVWTRLGFEPHHAVYTFHGWF